MLRILLVFTMLALGACGKQPAPAEPPSAASAAPEQPFEVSVDRFADVEVLRYEVPGFDELPLAQKKLAYYLSQAALAGRPTASTTITRTTRCCRSSRPKR